MTTLQVFPAVRHARLTANHAEVLFGDQRLRALHTLSWGGEAADAVVVVEGAKGRLELVRVVLPLVKESRCYCCAADVDVLGSGGPVTLIGPKGSVILASGAAPAERVVSATLKSARVDVQLEGERPRVVRGVVVEAKAAEGGAAEAVFVVDVDLKPGTTASVL